MKIKIVLTQNMLRDWDDDYTSVEIVRHGITDWEEVTDEEYEFLKHNLWRMNFGKNLNGLTPRIIVQDTEPLPDRIDSIKKHIKAEEARLERERLAEERKKAERKAKREQAKAAKTREQELATLAELQAKYSESK